MSSQKYVYIKSEPGLWTVGFYDPDGKWHAQFDYQSESLAAEKVHYLNGGRSQSSPMDPHGTIFIGEPEIGAPPQLVEMNEALPKIKANLQPDSGLVFAALAGVDMALIDKLNEKYDSTDWIGAKEIREAICEVQGNAVVIATAEYDVLLNHIRRGLYCHEPAAMANARIALRILNAYSPTTIAKEMADDVR